MIATAAQRLKSLTPALVPLRRKQPPLLSPQSSSKKLTATVTRNRREIFAAQRLRYKVFTEEFGASIKSRRGIDKDRFDRHCRHVIVKEGSTGQIVGYTRVLTDVASLKTKGFYSETEFDMAPMYNLPGRVLEIGRTCIHPEYRNGGTIAVLWARVAEMLVEEGFDYLIGCASISLADGGFAAQSILQQLRTKYMADEAYRVAPRIPLLLKNEDAIGQVKMPALLKAYLRMGARVCGEPFWDADFNVADVFIMLDMKDLSHRYSKHFMRHCA